MSDVPFCNSEKTYHQAKASAAKDSILSPYSGQRNNFSGQPSINRSIVPSEIEIEEFKEDN